MTEPVADWVVNVDADTSDLSQKLIEAQKLGSQFGSTLTSAFEGLAVRGKSLSDVMRGLVLSLSRMTLSAALKPLQQGLGSAFTGMLQAGLPSAAGSAAPAGLVVPFAKGGVVASPISFPLGNGRTGIAGERGPEAILPLTRGSDGSVGVRAAGTGGINIVFNVAAGDAASFQKAESEIAAMIGRAVGRGNRTL